MESAPQRVVLELLTDLECRTQAFISLAPARWIFNHRIKYPLRWLNHIVRALRFSRVVPCHPDNFISLTGGLNALGKHHAEGPPHSICEFAIRREQPRKERRAVD